MIFRLTIFVRAFAIGNQTVILVLTWLKTAGNMKHFATLNIQTSLMAMLFRDGTVYFVFLLLLNVVDLVNIHMKFELITAITEVITSILISRFILNLRSVYMVSQCSFGSSFHASRFDDILVLNTVVGNLGAPFDIGMYPEDADELEDDSNSLKVCLSHESLITGLEFGIGFTTAPFAKAYLPSSSVRRALENHGGHLSVINTAAQSSSNAV